LIIFYKHSPKASDSRYDRNVSGGQIFKQMPILRGRDHVMGFFKKMSDIITPWEFLILIGMSYILFDIPLGAAFKHSVTKPEIFFDLAMTAMLTWNALTRPPHHLIAKYPRLTHFAHWIPCLPFMTFAYTCGASGANWPIYLQAFRLFPLHSLIAAMLERSKTRLVPKRVKFAVAAVAVFIALNFLACAWLVIYPPGDDPVTDYNKAMYWLITTIATVGYGDITPSTNGGRVFAMGIMILGATIWGIMIASASRLMLEKSAKRRKWMRCTPSSIIMRFQNTFRSRWLDFSTTFGREK
jgi:Ion channel